MCKALRFPQTGEPTEALVLTLDSGKHGASHGQHESERTPEQEAVRHVKVEMARVHHKGGAAAAACLHAVLHQTRGGGETFKTVTSLRCWVWMEPHLSSICFFSVLFFLQEAHGSGCLSAIFLLHLVELLFVSDACATSWCFCDSE